jgi:hypothetical protein
MRSALPDDAPQLGALMGELGYPATREFIHEKLAQLSSTPGTRIFVADCGGKVIGLLSFSILPLLHVDGGSASSSVSVQRPRHWQASGRRGRSVCLEQPVCPH